MDNTTLAAIATALRDAEDSDTPTGAKTTATFTEALTAHVDELKAWVQELDTLVADVEGAVEDLAAADKEDRDDAHSALIGYVGALLDELPGARDADQ